MGLSYGCFDNWPEDMDNRRPPHATQNGFLVLCKRILNICTVILFFCGFIFAYCGMIAALIQCKSKRHYDFENYNWNCGGYYGPDLTYLSLELGLVLFTGLLLILGRTKTLRLPLLTFLAIITTFIIMGIQKYSKEYPGRGYFLKPVTIGNYGPQLGHKYYLKTDAKRHGYYYDDDDDDNDVIKKFEVMEVKSISTRHAPRKVIVVGYSFLLAGNLLLILMTGIGKLPSITFPSLGKYKKTADKFRSYLAAMIAPSTRPLSDDEEGEENNLVKRETENVS